MVGFFDDKTVGAVLLLFEQTIKIVFLKEFQAVEYTLVKLHESFWNLLIQFMLLRGPLLFIVEVISKKSENLMKKNLTEDIEIAWRFLSKGIKFE
jgi:hypothetical protein